MAVYRVMSVARVRRLVCEFDYLVTSQDSWYAKYLNLVDQLYSWSVASVPNVYPAYNKFLFYQRYLGLKEALHNKCRAW